MTIASNISGSKQRQIHAAIREAVSAKLASLDGPAGDRLLGKLDVLQAHVITGLDKLSAALALFAPERNEHGHLVFTISGLDLSGAAEIIRLDAAGYRFGDYARSCMASTRSDSYDQHHRLEDGRIYKIALVPGTEIQKDSSRTTANLRKQGEKYGYQKPLAGIVPRIREAVSDKQMEEWGFWYIAALHDPITDSDGDPNVLNADRDGDGRWVFASWGQPDGQWDTYGAFAFLVPASA